MANLSKRKKAAREKLEDQKAYELSEALGLVKELATAKFAEAEPFLLECHAEVARLVGDDNPQSLQFAALIGDLYRQWHAEQPGLGLDAKAEHWAPALGN